MSACCPGPGHTTASGAVSGSVPLGEITTTLRISLHKGPSIGSLPEKLNFHTKERAKHQICGSGGWCQTQQQRCLLTRRPPCQQPPAAFPQLLPAANTEVSPSPQVGEPRPRHPAPGRGGISLSPPAILPEPPARTCLRVRAPGGRRPAAILRGSASAALSAEPAPAGGAPRPPFAAPPRRRPGPGERRELTEVLLPV